MFNYRSRNASSANGRPGDAKNVAAAQSIGTLLRERREALGASLAEIEAATKIRQKYLSAIESDEWQLLPGEVIGRGFLRNYASYLGLEPAELVERRRAVTDPGVITILSSTSAGVALPAEREVDYRPREVDLREDNDEIEGRQVRVGPYLVGLLSIGLVALIAWSLYQYGSEVSTQLARAYQAVSSRVAVAFTADPTPTPVALTPTANAVAVAPTATLAPQSSAGGNQPAAGGNEGAGDSVATPAVSNASESGNAAAEPTSSGLVLPTPTNTVEAEALPPPTATNTPAPPTPAPQLASLTTNANFRSGPGTDFEVIGSGQPGQQISIIGRSPDGQWFQMDNNGWVFGQLVANQPANVAVIEAQNAPTATATQEGAPTEQPTSPPPPAVAVAGAACDGPGVAMTFPGSNQVLAGVVTVSGTANRDPFQFWKVELNGVEIGRGSAPVVDGALMSFDSTQFPNGAASLVLTAVDITANYSVCSAAVVIQN